MKRGCILFVVLLAWAQSSLAEIREYTPAQLSEPNDSIVIVDVRSQGEYDSGHLPGALHLPWDSITSRPGLLDAYKDKTIVTYCARGTRARAALKALERAGYTRLGHLEGDIPAWQQAGLPLE